MTDKEWKAQVDKETNKRLLKDLVYFGCDTYYYDLWQTAMNELAKRLKVDPKEIWR